jgi:hypothetical protein
MFRCITHPFATRRQGRPRVTVRLACVKHAASVQSEPGSNSSVQSFCLPVLTNQPLTQSNLQRSKITTREHFHYSQSFFTGQASAPPLLQVRTNRAITLYPIPCSAPNNTKHPHASAVYIFKERRRFSGGRFRRRAHYTDRNPRVNTFRVFHSQNSLFWRDRRGIRAPIRQDSRTRANFRFPT